LAIALFAGAAAHAQRPSPADPLYTQMRNSALRTPASTVGVPPQPGEIQAYGVS
jgi:hypothetical protein